MPSGPLTTAELATFLRRIASLDTEVPDAERVEQLGLLEAMTSAAAATKARVTVAFAESQAAEQAAAGMPAPRIGQGVAAQVALARRESPARAARYVGWAKILVSELPRTLAALQAGETTEWRAMIVARESASLTRAQRAEVDASLAGRLASLGDRRVEAEAKKLAYRLDPHGFLARSRAAANDRRVTMRPAPDTMARLTALLPVSQAVATYAALAKAADLGRAAGDERGRGQIMADTMVERVTGLAAADCVGVEVHLVMTDQTLLGTRAGGHPAAGEEVRGHRPAGEEAGVDRDLGTRPGGCRAAGEGAGGDRAAGDPSADVTGCADAPAGIDEPGFVVGYGPVPAGVARDIARGNVEAAAWVRRLYCDPERGELAAIDARRREFTGPIRELIIARDQCCRTPWCGAPIRHADHARSVAEGGRTAVENGDGLCEACNYAKQAPGWTTAPGPGGTGDSLIVTTPTGQTYASRPPDPPGAPTRRERDQRTGPAPPHATDTD